MSGFNLIITTIILSDKLVKGEELESGARPCVGLVSLENYLDELKNYPIETYEIDTPTQISKINQ